jgi:eukaryotic-like serine/threonine-protein kinase
MSHWHPEQPPAVGEGVFEDANSHSTPIRPGKAHLDSAEVSLVGRVLRNTYRILDVLEKGGMGTVYRGEHQRLKRPVAIKVLAQHLAADPSALTRFQREADIVSQLHHPHIVHILDFDTTEDGDPYIVMELLSGENLSRRIDRERILALRDVIQIVAQTAGGLVVAHAAGIVHRDLKPDNVYLLDMQDNSIFVKLLDFGISKRAAATKRVTGQYDVLGTPDYMAPEQVINTANADHRADQWSLAAMTYEMLCGRIPFYGETVVKTLAKVIGEEPRSLAELAPGIPKEMAAVVSRGLAKEPSRRFASIMEFADRLAESAGLSLDPRPKMWVGANSEVAAQRTPTLDTSYGMQPLGTEKRRLQVPRSNVSPESESRLPIPSFPEADQSPSPSAVQSINPHNPRLRGSDPPPPIPAESAPAPRRPAQGRLRASGAASDPGRNSAKSSKPRVSRAPPAVAEGAVPQLPTSHTPPAFADESVHAASASRPPLAFPDEATLPSVRQPEVTEAQAEALNRVRQALDEVRQAVTFGEDQRALSKARNVLQLVQAERSRETRQVLSNAAELLGPILLRSLGGLDRKMRLAEPQSARSQASISPEHVFLLSRIDGTTTVEELLDVSPLSTAETLGILIDFREQGLLGFE